MGKLEEIERAVSELPPDELGKFRTWFEQFQSDLFDAKIERDVAAGGFDELADRALADYARGRAREL